MPRSAVTPGLGRARWVAACATGELVGIGAAGLAALGVGEPRTLAGRFGALALMALAGAVEGAALAALEWRLLRLRLPRLRAFEWIAVTVAVAVLGWIAGMAGPLFAGAAATADEIVEAPAPSEPGLARVLLLATALGALAGFVFGGAQWLVLRRHAERAGGWVLVHVPAWAGAMALIFAGASLPDATWPPWGVALCAALGGLAGGAFLGVVTWPVVARLRPWVDERAWRLDGSVAAVTGATSGIGYETALGLARLGARVVLLARDGARGEEARRRILARCERAFVHVVVCDLASRTSVHRAGAELCARWPRLDLLVHSAGATFPERTLVDGGTEATLALDVVGPSLLTRLLVDRLEAASGAAVAVHPGAVRTRAIESAPWALRLLAATLARPVFVRAELGALPVLRLAATPSLGNVSGRFFDRFTLAPDGPDPVESAALWDALVMLAPASPTASSRAEYRRRESRRS